MSQRSEEIPDDADEFQQEIAGMVAPTPRGSKETISYPELAPVQQTQGVGKRERNRLT